MKIVCDACQAKYSISDDKVQGKVFKIRCKKCSNIIVVRGGAGAAEPAPQPAVEKDTRVYDYGYEGGAPAGDEAVWHVVINDAPVGPITAAEMQQRFSAGEIDAETYIWREGFAEWQPLSQVDAFASFAQTSAPTAAVGRGGGGGGAEIASMFGTTGIGDEAGTMRSDPADLFAAASASSRRGDDEGDLFGSRPGTGSRQAVGGNAAGEAAAAKLRGERNENSVLFSLNNLAQLASDKPAPITAPPSQLGAATGAAGGEGSGLIDIRSMANAYLGGGGGGAAKPATSSPIGSIDDLPVFGGAGFSEPAVIVPTSGRAGGNNKMMFVLIGAVGLLAIAAVILVVVMLGKKDPEKKADALAAADKTDKADKEPEKSDKEPDKTDPKPTEASSGSPGKGGETTEPKATENKTEPAATEDRPKPGGAPTTQRPTTPNRPAGGTVPKPATQEKPKPAETKPDAGGTCDEVSCVLNNYEGACCQKFRKGGSKPAGGGTPTTTPKSGGSDLPEKLDRAMISEGVARVKGNMMKCGDRSSSKGTVKVSVKVTPDGSISGVTVTATPDPGLGNCVASAMRGATFRKTQTGGTFGYPVVFQ